MKPSWAIVISNIVSVISNTLCFPTATRVCCENNDSQRKHRGRDHVIEKRMDFSIRNSLCSRPFYFIFVIACNAELQRNLDFPPVWCWLFPCLLAGCWALSRSRRSARCWWGLLIFCSCNESLTVAAFVCYEAPGANVSSGPLWLSLILIYFFWALKICRVINCLNAIMWIYAIYEHNIEIKVDFDQKTSLKVEK